MKRFAALILAVALTCGLHAQDSGSKTGWNFGALPTITFDTDLGFQYGGSCQSVSTTATAISSPSTTSHSISRSRSFTKGSGINRFMFDSDYLIPGVSVRC
jgi:hypothetical protein